eukprot:TRINITY_DN6909_c0_g1_i1.p1 TRINITY_DN6909_c0_g1~~TRINITY_DN6909_c0_g1_i1.p1  ORF type:complete len:298 (-),score=84.71 TRINITY_DN6909_c0_g1_i1:396-1289(-)
MQASFQIEGYGMRTAFDLDLDTLSSQLDMLSSMERALSSTQANFSVRQNVSDRERQVLQRVINHLKQMQILAHQAHREDVKKAGSNGATGRGRMQVLHTIVQEQDTNEEQQLVEQHLANQQGQQQLAEQQASEQNEGEHEDEQQMAKGERLLATQQEHVQQWQAGQQLQNNQQAKQRQTKHQQTPQLGEQQADDKSAANAQSVIADAQKTKHAEPKANFMLRNPAETKICPLKLAMRRKEQLHLDLVLGPAKSKAELTDGRQRSLPSVLPSFNLGSKKKVAPCPSEIAFDSVSLRSK